MNIISIQDQNDMEKSVCMKKGCLHHMNCYDIHEAVYSHNTNDRPAIDDKNALWGLNSILDFLQRE